MYCGGLEHKMGIKGNATAQIVLEGAIGTMVGQPNKGMQGMFVMMNAARLGVGNQSLGLTEVAYQNALAYAKDRIQMRSLSGPKAKDKAGRPHHRPPGCAQDAAHRQGLCRRRSRLA
jgi:alkylation response protein AidB-like acyl-CoA dehydrogenase